MQIYEVASQRKNKPLPGFVVKSTTYASLLATLIRDSQTYIATLEWRRSIGFRKRVFRAVCGSETQLVGFDTPQHNAVLLIPDWEHLIELRLTIFYKDDSVLTVSLGGGDVVKIVKPGEGEASERLQLARQGLRGRGMHPDLGLLLGLSITSFASGAGLAFVNNSTASAIFSILGLLFAFLAVSVSGSGLHPRPSRFGVAWGAMGWGLEDIRRLITAVLGGIIILVFGIWLGRR